MPRPDIVKAPCSVCGLNLQMRQDGNIRIHGPVTSRCPGSEQPPIPSNPPPDPPSTTTAAIDLNTTPLNPGRSNTRIISRIPRPARDAVARKLSEILNGVCSDNNEEAWNRLFLFSRRCLRAPCRGGNRRNLASFIQRVVNEETDIETGTHQQFKHSTVRDPLKNLAARVASKLEVGDFRGAVRIASSNDSFAPVNSQTLDLLKEKHPPRNPSFESPPEPIQSAVNSIVVTPSDILAAIRSFPAGSAGGPDGLRPQHLKDLFTSRSGLGANLLQDALCRFVNFVIKGEVLDEARPFFFGASLIALTRPDGGVRPIAVGCTLRRLVAKCVSQSIQEAMGDLLSPLQLGYGTPMGAEAAVHIARTYLHNMQSNQLILKIDFRNAFNSIRRDKMLLSVLEHVPEIYPLVFSAYRNPSYLFFDNNIVESAEGVQQGDPLGPLLFSLTIHHLLSHLELLGAPLKR